MKDPTQRKAICRRRIVFSFPRIILSISSSAKRERFVFLPGCGSVDVCNKLALVKKCIASMLSFL